MSAVRVRGPRVRSGAFARAMLAVGVLAGASPDAFADPAGAAGAAASAAAVAPPGGAKLARIDSAPVDVAGRIVASTRGHAGPVRLEIEGADGKRLPALLPPDDVLSKHGLSLQKGETVVLRGSMFQGPRPALVVTAVVVDGRPVEVRSPAGAAGPTAARASKMQKEGSATADGPARSR
ncbi:MAG: hypothetical protein ACKPBU_14845 [Alphaproteobacteria bacterium]